jgi:hypothetical protein
VGLLREPEVVRPYVYLDARFLTRLADLLPGATAPLQL